MLYCAFYHPCSNLSCDKSGCCSCLVPRRLSLDENVRAKEGGKETTGETSFRRPSLPFPWSLAVHHQSLVFRARLYDEKNEAPVVAGYEKLLQKVESKTHSIAFKHVLQQCCKNRLYVFAAHFTVTEPVIA